MDEKSRNKSPTLLIVDDDETMRTILSRAMAQQGFACHPAGNWVEALEVLNRYPVDVVLVDVDTPELGGIDLVQLIRAQYSVTPIVMSGHIDELSYEQMVKVGAVDYILKSMVPGEVVLRVRRALREHRLLKGLEETQEQLKATYLDTINRLVAATEYRDENTGNHIARMSSYSALLAEKMNLDGVWVDRIRYGAAMHDIGKIGIPEQILMKPSQLTGQECHVVRTHPTIGARILANSTSDVLKTGQQIAISHHEKWDGTGYPQGLSGRRIPLSGRIVCIADVFDALSTRRPYKDPYPPDVIHAIIEDEREKHFDPDLADIMLENFDAFLAIRNSNVRELLSWRAAFSWSGRDARALQEIT